jgi:hypothetical protein
MFASFFLAGFEGTTGFNQYGQWIDQIAATQHDRYLDDDYRMLRESGILAARDSVRWPLVDNCGRYDFSTVKPLVRAARMQGVEVIYDLFHFGFPSDVDLFSRSFPARFSEYCASVARFISQECDGICYFTPVNEPSYFSWAAGEQGCFKPYQKGRGWELKVALIRAAIQGIDAIRSVCPDARFVNVDPVCRVVAPPDRPDLEEEAAFFNREVVFQGWDMLAGRLTPELGGSPEHLDIVGVNYYWTNQWELHRPGVTIDPGDPRYWPVRRLLRAVASRYQRDILVTETSHVGDMRGEWLRQVAYDAARVLGDGWPLRGICLYPATGMPEWHAPHEWTPMGFWDLVPRDGELTRVWHEPMLEALRDAQRELEGMQHLEPKLAG